MIYKMYCIRDSAVEAYNRPFCARAHGEAMRNFENECRNGESPMAKNPEHFSLWYIGEFGESDGVLMPAPLVCLAKAHEVIEHA